MKNLCLSLLIAVFVSPFAQSATVPYFTDFEGGVPPEWTSGVPGGSPDSPLTRFNGPYSNDSREIVFDNLVVGTSYTVLFDLYVIDSWDGGSDTFIVRLDGTEVVRGTLSNFGQAQTFPFPRSQGPEDMISVPGWPDSIYRAVTFTFEATNSVATISFAGQNLEGVGNESWGIDNFRVQQASTLTTPQIHATTLPPHNSSVAQAIDQFTIASTVPVDAILSTNLALYTLREAGGNGTPNDGDDVIIPLQVIRVNDKAITLALTSSPLQPGVYQFQATGLVTTGAVALSPYTRTFTIAIPALTALEDASNNEIPEATPLTLTQSPVGSQFYTVLGIGTHSPLNDPDFWRFEAEAGDVVSVRVESHFVGVYPQLYIHNSAGGQLAGVGGSYEGVAWIQNYTIGTPGSYYIRTFSGNRVSPYRMLVTVARGVQSDHENNNTPGAANDLELSIGTGVYQGKIAGRLHGETTDYFRLGTLNTGNALNASLTFPANSTLNNTNVVLSIFVEGGTEPLASNTNGTLNFTATINGVHYLALTSNNGDLLAQYILNSTITDGVAPVVSSTSLPNQAGSTNAIINDFTVTFSEELAVNSVTNLSHYELRSLGTDLVSAADDQIYTLLPLTYSGGYTITLRVTDGPLQQGAYRLTLTTGLNDRANNHLAANFVRNFNVSGVDGFITENRSNNQLQIATSLSTNLVVLADGTFTSITNLYSGNNPYFVVQGNFNADAHKDLAVANFYSNNVVVYTGNGNGTFNVAGSFPAGANPIALAVGTFNNDSHLDLAVANWSGGNISILLGTGTGTFGAPTNFSTASNPRSIAVGDLNGDLLADLVIANYGNDSATVLLGNGNGTFDPAVNYPSGNGPHSITLTDVDENNVLDLLTVSEHSDNLNVRLGNGDGTFGGLTNFSVGDGPRSFAAADLNNDGFVDLVVANNNGDNVAVLRGAGNGTFTNYQTFPLGNFDSYHVQLADFNGDTRLDAALANYGGSELIILHGTADGSFQSSQRYSAPGAPIAIAVADYNTDGILDLATAGYDQHHVKIWLGNKQKFLTPDAANFRTVFGRGALTSSADLDIYSFTGEAGDRVMLASEVPGNPVNSGLRYDLLRADGTSIVGFHSDYRGFGQIVPFILPQTGTYYVQVSHWYDWFAEYRFRVSLVNPDAQIETENNNAHGNANVPSLVLDAGALKATVAGYIGSLDGQDTFGLGYLSGTATLNLEINIPATSDLSPILEILDQQGAVIASAAAGITNLSHSFPGGQSGYIYARVRADSGAGLAGHYSMSITLTDTSAPLITGISLPSGTTNTYVSPYFTIGFSEDMLRTTVTNGSFYELRSAGPNNTFGNSDDVFYTIRSEGYSSGLSATFNIVDGPLRPGKYRFTIPGDLLNRSGIRYSTLVQQEFTVAAVEGYVLENRSNNDFSLATSLSLSAGATPDGSFLPGSQTIPSGGQPWHILATSLNNDLFVDLVIANWPNNSLSVLMGQAGGTFHPPTNYTVGVNPIAASLVDVNDDNLLDAVVANYSTHNVSVLLGTGNGTFGTATNFAVDNNPRMVVTDDFNGDDIPDIVTANYGPNTVSILFGNGDGTFRSKTNYTVGNNPYYVQAGNLNSDSAPDLVVANQSATTISVLMNNGNGTFATQVTYTVGSNPRALRLADFNGDSELDVVTVNAAGNYSVLLGNGDGTFQTATTIAIGLSDPHQLVVSDINADNKLDVIIPNYGQGTIITLLGKGDGTFIQSGAYDINPTAGSVDIADVNRDGRKDIIAGHYNSSTLRIFYGSDSEFLTEDPASSLVRTGTARGHLTTTADVDFWSFSAKAGDRLVIAAENPEYPSNSGLFYSLYGPDFRHHFTYNPNSFGYGQSGPFVVPFDGTYYVRVSQWYDYLGEYRFRVTLAGGGKQIETEANNSHGTANSLNYSLEAGHQKATVVGYIGYGDPGDHFQLGNLSVGTAIRLGQTNPVSSGLSAVIQVLNSTGEVLAESSPSGPQLEYIVPEGGEGAYFARVYSVGPSRAGDPGPYLSFDGGNGYVDTGAWAPGKQWTVEAWVRPSAYPGGRRGIAGSFASCQDWGLALNSGRFAVSFRPLGGACSETLTAPELPALDTWHHVAASSDGTNIWLYVNGELKATAAVAADFNPTAAGTRFGGEVCCGNYFPGLLDNIRVWNKALSGADILANLNTTLTGTEPGLIGLWNFEEGTGTTVADATAQNRAGTLANNVNWVAAGPVGSTGPGLMAQYILSIDLGDTAPPSIASVSLPAEDSTVTFVHPSFTIGFSEDMAPATVMNTNNIELRSAGADETFNTPDDQLYSITASAYVTGLSASYLISNGPLQEGFYKFTISTAFTDRSGSPLPAPYIREFQVSELAGFILENRTNNSPLLSTSLSTNIITQPNGSFDVSNPLNTDSNPYGIAIGNFNGDQHNDFVVSALGQNRVMVFLGLGGGAFTNYTNIVVGNSPRSTLVADLNKDNLLDIAVGNYLASSISVLLGNGDGTFQPPVIYPVGGNPRSIITADLNGDTRLDLLSANENSDNISVLLNNGTSFAAAVNFSAGDGAFALAAGRFDADQHLDVAVANANAGNLILYLGAGDGSLQVHSTNVIGSTLRGLVSADFDGDTFADLATLSAGNNTYTVLLGNGDATFTQSASVAAGTADPYQMISGDLNLDGRIDLLIPAFGNDRVVTLLGNGDGTFEPFYQWVHPNGPLASAIGDLNGDGRPDIATANYYSSTVRILFGTASHLLGVTSLGNGIRQSQGRGQLTSGDVDWWQFSARAGDRLELAAETPGNVNNSQLLYEIYYTSTSLDNSYPRLLYFYTQNNGQGQTTDAGNNGILIPNTGTYYVRITQSDAYTGEYRFRLTIAEPPTRFEAEANNTRAAANTARFTNIENKLRASILGYFHAGDTTADFSTLGNLSPGTRVQAFWTKPSTSDLSAGLELQTANGTVVASATGSTTNIDYTIPGGGEGIYYIRIYNDNSPFGIASQYRLQIDLSDAQAPLISGISLPENDATTAVIDRFTISFSEEMGLSAADPDNYELIAVGPDNELYTEDDQSYTLQISYGSGLDASVRVLDGPLQAGNYRFRALTGIADRFGNNLAEAFDQEFVVEPLPHFTIESRSNNSAALATPLTLIEDPSLLHTAFARGNLSANTDVDYFSFSATNGQKLLVAVQNPGFPGGSSLRYTILNPSQQAILDFYGDHYGWQQSAVATLAQDGLYTLLVRSSQNYQGEYQVRVSLASGSLEMEAEDNPGLASANNVTLVENGNGRRASVVGNIRFNGDLDYYRLGTLTNGSTVFLGTRLPSSSGLEPTVSIYDASNGYMVEAGSGRPFDGVAEVRISNTGVYYAVVRGADNTTGITSQYVLDIQVVPTGSVAFPNLQVTSLTTPTGSSIQSGQSVQVRFTISNVGSEPTTAGAWSDRAVISQNNVLGDADDIQLGIFQRNGNLPTGGSYEINQPLLLPHGISGVYYLIVQADLANSVNEFVLEGDNVTVSFATFSVARAPYPDLRVEDLAVTGPSANQFTINWNTANRGSAPVTNAFKERLIVRNVTAGSTLLNVERNMAAGLAVNGTSPQSAIVTATTPGLYEVSVTTDSLDNVYEFNEVSHASAEQNLFETTFRILAKYNVVLSSNPGSGGSVSGAGQFTEGTTVNVTATPNTAQLPYQFLNWTENGIFQSANPSYSFELSRDRQLVANFTLPTYTVTANSNPAGGGSVTGAGSHAHGATAHLTAVPAFGYRFKNWTLNGSIIGVDASLSFVVLSNRTVVANYDPAHLTHNVVTETEPEGLAVVTGSGTFNNGQSVLVSAPAKITNNLTIFSFHRFLLNGSLYQTTNSFTELFATTDPTNMLLTAEYTSRSRYPLIIVASANIQNPIPRTTNLLLALQFNRSMDTNVVPALRLTNSAAGSIQPVIIPGGTWSSTAVSNDTFHATAIVIGAGMDGTNKLHVSLAQDTEGAVMQPVNPLDLLVDATSPLITGIVVERSSGSAIVTWTTDEPATSQVEYGLNSGFGRNTPVNVSLTRNHRVVVSGLIPETLYHFRVHSRDQAGNSRASASATFTTLPAPDLVVSGIRVEPALIQSGSTLLVTWTNANTGVGPTSGSWYDQIIISNRTTGQLLDTEFVRFDAQARGDLLVNGVATLSHAIELAQGPAGAGEIEVRIVADFYNNLVEDNEQNTAESNNRATLVVNSTLRLYPDLRAQNLAIAPSSLNSGVELTASWETYNSGDAPASGLLRDRIVIRNATTGEILLNNVLVYDTSAQGNAALQSGQSIARQAKVFLPEGNRGVGQIQVEVVTDFGNGIFEFDPDTAAENNNTTVVAANSILSPYPDLAVTSITAPLNGRAGQTIEITWTIHNRGNGVATGSWSEQVFLSEDNTAGGDTLLATFNYNGPLPTNGTIVRTETVTLPRFGTGNRWVIIRVDAGNTLFEHDEANNFSIDDRAINLPSNLFITFSRSSISEGAGINAVLGTITRNSGTAAALEITLASSDTGSLTVPPTITIPANNSAQTFPVHTVDDDLLDGNKTVSITASAAGVEPVSESLNVIDDDAAILVIEVNGDNVRENTGTVPASVRRNTSTGSVLVVNLISSEPSRVTVPSTVNISAGQDRANFAVTLLDNPAPNRPLRVTISANASGYQNTPDTFTLLDDDIPALSLELADSIVSEGASNPATEATVTRSPVSNRALTILLHSENELAAKVPFSVVIPPNVASVTFPVTVIDDELVDPSEEVQIHAYAADELFSTRIEENHAHGILTVTDDDGPTLKITVDNDVVSERGATVGRVSRNTATTSALIVNLSSEDQTEITVPNTVTIPVGQRTAPFAITGVSDGAADGVQRAAVTASATGFTSGNAAVNVTDFDLPDIRVTEITVPNNAASGAAVEISWTVANDGLSIANGPWVDKVYVSTSPDGSVLQPIGQYFRTASLDVGQSYVRTVTATLPFNPGNYYLVVHTDANGALSEGSKRNNTLISSQVIDVRPAYRATVSTDVQGVPMQTPVTLRGRAFRSGTDEAMPFALVSVRLNIKGTRRVIEVRTDAAGNFETIFQPLPGEAGVVRIGADHPGVTEDPVQDQFNIYGMRFTESEISYRMFPVSELAGTVELRNIGDVPLTGVSAIVEGLPSNVLMAFQLPTTLESLAVLSVPFTINTGEFTNEVRIRARIKITSAQSAVTYLPLNLTVAPHSAHLVATPGFLESGMTRGRQKLMEFEVVNTGGAGSGPLEVRTPNVPWMSLVSESSYQNLAPGASIRVVLALNPPADMPLTRYDGSIVVDPTVGNSIDVAFRFRALSESRGDLRVEVTDDYTFHVAGAPRVEGASVTLTDGLTGQTVASGLSDTNGIVFFTNILENTYQLTVNATKHNTYRAPVTIIPGITNEVTTFIDRQTVSYRWTVVPTQIDDHYKVVLEPVFEAEVPIPVVTIDNPLLMPLIVQGLDTQMEITVRNHGLIAAERVSVVVPNHPDFEVIPLVEVIDVLPARSSLKIPILIRAKPTAQFVSLEQMRSGARLTRQGGTTFTGCQVYPKLQVKWSFVCGPDRRWHVNDLSIVAVCVEESCWDKIKDLLEDKATGNPKDLLEWKDQLCEIAGVLASCVDECLATIVKMACGVATRDVAGAVGAAAGFGQCWCPNLPSLPVSAPGYTPPPIGIGGGGSYAGGSPNYPIGAPIYWDYSPNCNPGDEISGGSSLSQQAETRADGVCARVRLRIEQEAVITRAAFLGTLELENGNLDSPLTGIQLTLDIRDENQNSVNGRFAVRGPVLDGISATDGTGVLAAGADGSAQFTFIPNREAAPDGPTIYRIGGTLRYTEGTNVVEVPLIADTITVYPDPILNLIYFQQRDVYSDDPFTDEIEPAEPFALGLLVKNTGKGAAINFRITSAQPEIIENKKGLLIDFKIIGTQVGGDPVTPTLTANLGRIEPASTKAAIWQMVSTLQGKFIEYNATFEHIDGLGDPRLSLIDSVEVHELIHAVLADRATDDNQPDFLVNDDPDPDNAPDTLWLSDGSVAVVNPATAASTDGNVSRTDLQVQLTATMSSGWNYLKIADPGAGYRLYRVLRSDGKEIKVTQNAWTTDRSFPSSQTGARRENLFHMLDFNGTGNYTLFYRVNDSNAPEITDIVDIDPVVQSAAISTVDVRFSEAIDLETFTHEDIHLSLNGGENLITDLARVSRIDDLTYRITGLSTLTAGEGNYELTVQGAGIADFGGNAAIGFASVRWSKAGLAPVIATVEQIVPQLRNLPVPSLDVVFSKAINPATFDYTDLSLTLNGGPNLINSTVVITPLTASSYRITGLGSLTADTGEYTLTIYATNVADGLGNLGIGQLSSHWIQDIAGPVVSSLEQVNTNPRNIVVPGLEVTFSEEIDPSTFDLADITLTRDGGPNLINNQVTITRLTSRIFRISEFSWVSGTAGRYTLTVNGSAVRDPAGNAGSGSASASWVMDISKPAAPTLLAITPDLGRSSTDGITSSNRFILSGSLGETNLTVRLMDITGNEELGTAIVTNRSFTKALELPQGPHRLRAVAIDDAANLSDPVFLELFVDLVAPGVTIPEVTPDPRDGSITSLDIIFSEEINAATFTRADLTLTLGDSTVNLIDAGVQITFVATNRFRIEGLEDLTDVPGLYRFTVNMSGIEDVAGNKGLEPVSETWRRIGPNTPPVINQITTRIISAETLLVITNRATDNDIPANTLSFSLNPGAPSGASINPTNGVFTWRPTRLQAPSTNQITVRVTDNGIPALSATMQFTVVVTDYAELHLGNDILEAGTRGSVPVSFFASTAVTNFTFLLNVPAGYLTNITVDALTPAIGRAQIQKITDASYRITIGTIPGQSIAAREEVAEISFDTITNKSSAFLRLVPTELTVTKLDNTTIERLFTSNGRVVFIGPEPLLEALITSGERRLILYGKRNRNYRLDSSSLAVPWAAFRTVTLQNLFMEVDGVSNNPFIFYRALLLP
ncbi:MAG: FG-GAP-like repeat-containing protein [Verrucomicrobiota bacterium]|nr:FG-GAP-like repeat-containing protein [Verrucomicrobiota bacterium]